MTAQSPILCTLSTKALKERLQWLAELRERALLRSNRSGLTLTMLFSSSAEADVFELVHREKDCCAFLEFQTATNPDGVLLTITAPAEAGFAVDELFDCFAPNENYQQ